MSTFEEVATSPAHTHEGAANPTQSVVGAKVGDLWLNTTSGEQFRCHVQTFGSQEWLGSQGNTVGQTAAILLPTHPNLVVMYTMDNIQGGTLVDETGNGNLSTINGPISAGGVIGNALLFNSAAEDNVYGADFPQTSNLTELTITGWVKTATTSFGTIVAKWAGTTATPKRAFACFITADGRLQFNISSSGSNNTSVVSNDTTLSNDTWRFCTCVFNTNSDMLIYIDSVLDATLPTILPSIYETDIGVDLGILNREADGSPSSYYGGLMDQVRLFNRALTQEEITALYNEGTP